MTKKIMSLCALAIAAVFAFAFKAEPLKVVADQQFELISGGTASNPSHYVAVDAIECPLTGSICVVDVFNADVFTLAEATAAGNPAWAGKPKVNQVSTGIPAELTAAVSSSSDPYVPASGRSYFKRAN